jgi:hypothetical protein
MPPAFTINPSLAVVPCNTGQTGCLDACKIAQWGIDMDIQVTNTNPSALYINVLIDWNQDGRWAGASVCTTASVPEHVLVNHLVGSGFSGPLSLTVPPTFQIGPDTGYVWARFSITDASVPFDWDGSGEFLNGETCDYLLCVQRGKLEYGDAPEGATAYPWLGVIGQFPTCTMTGPAGFISHASTGQLYFGPSVDREVDGNAGNCPNFPPYDADECYGDGDAGLLFPRPYTMDPSVILQPCTGTGTRLGYACQMAVWGTNIDITVTNLTPSTAFANAMMDWNQNGAWAIPGSPSCPGGGAPERVLINIAVPSGFSGPLSALAPPAFRIGPNTGYVWCRFTVTPAAIPLNWTGAGTYPDGETSDYLLRIDPDPTGVEQSAGSVTQPLLSVQPNPFRDATTIRLSLSAASEVAVDIFDVSGRRVRALFDGPRIAGRHDLVWDGRDGNGDRVPAGTYLVQMKTGKETVYGRLVLMR